MDPLQETHRQLSALRAELQGSNSELYRHLALYLQVLREGLLNAIQQACFRLATQILPDRYCRISSARRQEWHHRMADLARRARTLLTVEQVAAMAAQIARAEQRERAERQKRLLEELHHGGLAMDSEDSGAEGAGRGPGMQPDGSIRLGMRPPIDLSHLRPQATPEPEASEPPERESASPGEEGRGLEAMLQGFAEALQAELASPTGEPGIAAAEDLLAADERPKPSPWEQPTLPDDPETLLSWLEGYEAALARRLRNLSHALNVDGLRLGLLQGLLPVGLLDAALQGQVDMLPAPANLLRLQLPVGAMAAEGPIALVAVLLRLSDLELENPRLRTCRQRLQQHTQQVRRMAQTYRRVQRRMRTLEAERLWLEDNRTPETEPPQPRT